MPEAPSLRSPIDRGNLRRADWRVLLPVPANGFDHMVLLGGPPGLSDVVGEIGLARRISREIPDHASADSVAILRGAPASCEDVARALLPGGALYWEVESRHARAAWIRSRIGRRLRRAQLSMTGLYWVRPDFERCELFIPIDVRTALRWYLRSLADASFPLRRFLVSRFAATTAAEMVVRVVRHCAVTAIAGPLQDGCPSILAHPAVPPDLRQAGAFPLVINRAGRDGSRRVIIFPFRSDSTEPAAVLKFSRLAERNAGIEEEQEIVTEIRSRLDPMMRRSIPKPLGRFAWGRVVVGVETYAGSSLASHATARTRRRIEDLRLVARWLQEFRGQTQVSRDPFSASQMQTWIENPLHRYGLAFGVRSEEASLFKSVRERAGSLFGLPFPLGWSHGGFSEWNVCRSGDEISVIDWEGARIEPPLCDLIYFVTVWHYRSRRRSGEDDRLGSFRQLFFPNVDDPLALLASAALDEYMTGLSVDSRFFPVMLVLTWVTHALGRVTRDRSFGEPAADARRGNPHVAFLGVLAENRDRLFSEERP